MNIIVGLGNPGNVYENTRHNVGFTIVKGLAEVLNCKKFSLKKKLKAEVCKEDQNVLVMPQTFMNGSGFAIKAVIDYYQKGLQNLYVIHDDLDIPLGEYKIKYGSGPLGHNGLLSAYQHLGTKNFWHVRVGIDTREGDRTIASPVYVLQKFNQSETDKFNTIKTEIIKDLKNLIRSK
jgi:peptidyl-tRNA hydrolase, PTH1 family